MSQMASQRRSSFDCSGRFALDIVSAFPWTLFGFLFQKSNFLFCAYLFQNHYFPQFYAERLFISDVIVIRTATASICC